VRCRDDAWLHYPVHRRGRLSRHPADPVGAGHGKLCRFLVFTLSGTALWNLLLIAGGSWLAGAFDQSLVAIDWMVVAMAVAGVGYYAWRLATWRPQRRRTA
jgi:membrane protein DedA with SNARE-associated domain